MELPDRSELSNREAVPPVGPPVHLPDWRTRTSDAEARRQSRVQRIKPLPGGRKLGSRGERDPTLSLPPTLQPVPPAVHTGQVTRPGHRAGQGRLAESRQSQELGTVSSLPPPSIRHEDPHEARP